MDRPNISMVGQDILDSAVTALIDSEASSLIDYRPQFVSNDYHRGRKVLSVIKDQLEKCVSFDFSVAFVTEGGVEPLLPLLQELEKKKVPGRILTTDYLAFSDPKALARLDSFSNIQVRMFQTEGISGKQGFHTKGYMFHYPNGTSRVLVGSSNLTGSALSVNREWNLGVSSLEEGALLRDIQQEFQVLWTSAVPLSGVIEAYRAMHEERRRIARQQTVVEFEQLTLEPNKMQLAFMTNLDELIKEGAERALLISATGTGKTFASAFAIRHMDPERVLFLAHREQVLKQSIKSYRRVLGSTRTYGLLSGTSRDQDKDFVFATMQTISRDEHLTQFDPEEFDVIVVDEVHRAGSNSYLKILDYFKPKFCLGMTASPDRPDGFDIYGLFNNEIAYEIRLQGALENDLLCPFHYFGITDLSVDGVEMNELTDFSHLVSDNRVDHIIQQAEFYGYSGERVKGLAFCRNRAEAAALSAKFNERGYASAALSGDDSQSVREEAIERLVCEPDSPQFANKLDYLFTVDIFNEGVDIPEVNQVLMLRPTESPIVFVQQLGRGLRKSDDKEFVVVIDFIGNYTNNYMIPIALSGDRTYNKDSIRKYVMEGERVIPGCSTVHFDEIAKKRIFESIDNTTISMRFLNEKYKGLKHKLGRIPFMVDFQEYGEVDPLLFVEKKKSYYRYLAGLEPEFAERLSEEEQLVLEFMSRYFGNGMRPHELLAVKELIHDELISREKLEADLSEEYGVVLTDRSFQSTLGVLDKSFVNAPGDRTSYNDIELIEMDDESIVRSADFARMLANDAFLHAVNDLLDFGLMRYKERYADSNHGLTLYEKYSRKDVCRLLNWEKDNSSTVYGYRISYDTCPIFVTYNKSDEIASSTQYADEFESKSTFSWMTRSRLTLESAEVQKIIHADETDLDIRLFAKKSDSEGSDFYYFGKVHPVSWRQTVQMDDDGVELPIVNFKLSLEQPCRDDIYAYFEGPDEMETASETKAS